MNDRAPERQVPNPAGLCSTCVHVQLVHGARTTFYLCRLSFTDPRFPRYPPIPVLACDGFEPRENVEGS